MPTVYVGLGSNLGDRRAWIRQALRDLNRIPRTRVTRRSRIRETDPVGRTDQPRFLNAVVQIDTRLTPVQFLRRLQRIESELGRVRKERWGPRTVDLDVLLWENRVIARRQLRVPHPRLAERRFVLEPLAELCPDAEVPGTGRTVRELLRSVEDRRA